MVRLGVDDTLSSETSDAGTFREGFTRVPANRLWCRVVDKTNVVEFIAGFIRGLFVTVLGDSVEIVVEIIFALIDLVDEAVAVVVLVVILEFFGMVDILGEEIVVVAGGVVELAVRGLIILVVLRIFKEAAMKFLLVVVICVVMARLGIDDTLSDELSDIGTFRDVFTSVPANRLWSGVVESTNVVEFIARGLLVTVLGDLLEAAVEFTITFVI